MCSGEKDAHHTVAALCSSRWKMYDNLSWVGWGREQQDVNVFEVVVDKLGAATQCNIECSLLCEGQGQEKSGFDSKLPPFGSKCHLGNLVNHLTHWLFPLVFWPGIEMVGGCFDVLGMSLWVSSPAGMWLYVVKLCQDPEQKARSEMGFLRHSQKCVWLRSFLSMS